jgi:nucleoside-diphosphate-sugar epimerase
MKLYQESDLNEIASESESFLTLYAGKSILVAGATGFVGSWLLSLLDFANRKLATNFEITAIARVIPQEFQVNFPGMKFLTGDVSQFDFGHNFYPDCIFNAATPSVPKRGGEDPVQILKAATEGTQNLLRLHSASGKTLFINLSSGIVSKRSEDTSLDLSLPKDAYLYGKRISEDLVKKATLNGEVIGINARLYAFAGPGISLTDHFAVGNFLQDAVSNRPIVIRGNPRTIRSYLYPTDLIINLLNLSVKNISEPFDVGSYVRITMHDLARVINDVTGNNGITQLSEYGISDEYIPKTNLNPIPQLVDLDESILRWLKWLKS